MKRFNSQAITAISLYIVVALVLAIFTYRITHKYLLEGIDSRLYAAAYATAKILGDKFHSKNIAEDTLDDEQDLRISLQLTDLVHQIGVEYVYTLVREENNGGIYFLTSSATKEEIENNNIKRTYFSGYPEADQAIYQAFDKSVVTFSEYTDRWGEFRSVFVPLVSSDGRQYVAGADISIAEVNILSRQSAFIALIIAGLMAMAGIPLIYVYLRSLQKQTNLELAKLYLCPLTGLSNRAKLLQDLEEDEDGANVAIINIDQFREITNGYGSAIGDSVLKQFALRLANYDSSKLESYYTYRLNADEFAVLVKEEYDSELMRGELSKLYKHLTVRPYQIGEKTAQLRVRIGAAHNVEDAFMLADMAAREAAADNKSLVVYTADTPLPTSYLQNFERTQQFKQALDENRIIPHFQPIMRAETGTIEKYEALARMVDAKDNVIDLPNNFLPLAHRSRLYSRLTRTMLDKVLNRIAIERCVVSINLSISDITDTVTRSHIFKRISASKLGKYIEFEILEDQSIQELYPVSLFIKRLQSLGCRVGLDDLGKDYSNVDRLMALPIDFVKIDGSVVLHMASDPEAQKIAKEIVDYSHNKGVLTVAEFCCNQEVIDTVRSLGVDYLQGNYIGFPTADFVKHSSNDVTEVDYERPQTRSVNN